MYYIMNDDGQFIERWEHVSAQGLAQLAEDCKCDLWVIEGQHSGITYKRAKAEPQQIPSYSSSDPPPRPILGYIKGL